MSIVWLFTKLAAFLIAAIFLTSVAGELKSDRMVMVGMLALVAFVLALDAAVRFHPFAAGSRPSRIAGVAAYALAYALLLCWVPSFYVKNNILNRSLRFAEEHSTADMPAPAIVWKDSWLQMGETYLSLQGADFLRFRELLFSKSHQLLTSDNLWGDGRLPASITFKEEEHPVLRFGGTGGGSIALDGLDGGDCNASSVLLVTKEVLRLDDYSRAWPLMGEVAHAPQAMGDFCRALNLGYSQSPAEMLEGLRLLMNTTRDLPPRAQEVARLETVNLMARTVNRAYHEGLCDLLSEMGHDLSPFEYGAEILIGIDPANVGGYYWNALGYLASSSAGILTLCDPERPVHCLSSSTGSLVETMNAIGAEFPESSAPPRLSRAYLLAIAKRCFENTLEYDPRNAFASANLISVFRQMGVLDLADEVYSQAVARSSVGGVPDLLRLEYALVGIARSRTVEDMERDKYLEEALAALGEQGVKRLGRASYNQACILSLLGRQGEAWKMLRKAQAVGDYNYALLYSCDHDLDSLRSHGECLPSGGLGSSGGELL